MEARPSRTWPVHTIIVISVSIVVIVMGVVWFVLFAPRRRYRTAGSCRLRQAQPAEVGRAGEHHLEGAARPPKPIIAPAPSSDEDSEDQTLQFGLACPNC